MRERKLFFEAVEITDPDRREKFLRQRCHGKPELRARVDALLAAANSMGDFLQLSLEEDEGASNKIESSKQTNRNKTPQAQSPVPLDFLEPATDSNYIGRLGHYDIIEVLGFGAFGIVLKGFDRRLHRQVAIKVLLPQLALTSPPRKRFLREARTCAAIQHINVVHVYDVADKPIPYIAMELVDGKSLQEHIDDSGPLEISEVIEIGRQLASGLEAAHAAGLIHRDIKPSNILIENRTQLRSVLTDFGLARAVDDASLTQSGVLTGTPHFMSPEQAQGNSLDHRSDLFSLGSLLYVMITGRLPFRARGTVAVLQRVSHDTPRTISELTPDCPKWLSKLVNQLQEKDRDQRIQSASEVWKWLERGKKKTTKRATSSTRAETNVTSKQNSSREEVSTRSKFWNVPVLAAAFIVVVVSALLIKNQMFPASELSEKRSMGAEVASSPVNEAGDENLARTSSIEQRVTLGGPVIVHEKSNVAPPPAETPFDVDEAKKHQQRWADHLEVPVEFTDSLSITYRLIPPGEFMMGTSEEGIQMRMHHVENEGDWKLFLLSEAPQHRVKITKPFYLATTEVTQNLYESIMSYNPSHFQSERIKEETGEEVSTFDSPVEGASWDDIQKFLKRLNQRFDWSKVKGGFQQIYRLPTEAEWEFACRGGTQTNYWTGIEIDSLVSHENHGGLARRIMPVGSFKPNPFGLYDMSGNVHEYVQDRWDAQYHVPSDSPVSVDPVGPQDLKLTKRVARGGDYWWWAYHSRSAYRIGIEQSKQSGYTIGFRLAFDIDSYRMLTEATLETERVTDFSIVRGVTKSELEDWLKSIRGKHVPTRINLRWGTEKNLFDAVAVSDEEHHPWQVSFFDTDYGAGQDYKAHARTHDLCWKLLFPPPDVPPMKGPGLKIWHQGGKGFFTYNLGEGDLQEAVDKFSRDGWLPMSLTYTESGNQTNSAFVRRKEPGVGNQSFIGLTLDEYKKKAEEFKKRQWRLHFFQLQVGTPELRLSCTFRENLEKKDWEMSYDLNERQFNLMVRGRRLAGWYPSCVGSYVENGETKYLVCWEKMREINQPQPIRKRDPGGFGG